jgi:hypothetical protein
VSEAGYYKLPLSDDYLILLGRQARACGGIELITKWLLRAFLNPHDVNQPAAQVRRLSHAEAVDELRRVAPGRLSGLGSVQRLHVERNLGWLDEAGQVMRKRNDYLHGFWLAPDDEAGIPAGYWNRRQERVPVPIDTLRPDVEKAERVERGGVSVLRYACVSLDVPRVAQ